MPPPWGRASRRRSGATTTWSTSPSASATRAPRWRCAWPTTTRRARRVAPPPTAAGCARRSAGWRRSSAVWWTARTDRRRGRPRGDVSAARPPPAWLLPPAAGGPHSRRRQRQLIRLHAERAERVGHGIREHGRWSQRPALADAAHAERVGRGLPDVQRLQRRNHGGGGHRVLHERSRQELPLGVVDVVLEQRAADALGDRPLHLALDDERVDHAPGVLHAHVPANRDGAGLGLDLHHGSLRALRARPPDLFVASRGAE